MQRIVASYTGRLTYFLLDFMALPRPPPSAAPTTSAVNSATRVPKSAGLRPHGFRVGFLLESSSVLVEVYGRECGIAAWPDCLSLYGSFAEWLTSRSG